MSLFGTMKTAVSGMNAQSNRLAAVGDNIANSSTTAYKRASVSFSSLVLPSTSGSYNSGGVSSSTSYSISEQGALTYTTSETDLAIQGEGFFVVEDSSGAIFLTRSGDFAVNDEGYLVNSAGYTLLGYSAEAGKSSSVVVNSYEGLEAVNISLGGLSASASTKGTLVANLPYNAEIVGGQLVDVAPSENSVYSAYTYKMSYSDDTGNTDVYYTKLKDDTWEVSVYVDYSGTATGFPYDLSSGDVVMATTTLTFDPGTGAIISGDTKLYPDASDPYYLDFSGLTQQSSASSSMLTVNFTANMPSDAPKIDVGAGDEPASANVAGADYTVLQSVSGLPGLPAGTAFDVYYTKTDDYTWEVAVYDAANATAGGFPYGPSGSAPLATLLLTYDPATGALTSGASVDIVLTGGETLTLDFAGSVSIPDLTAGWEDGVDITFNLPASAAAIQPSLIDATPADNVATSTYTNKTSLTVYDALGGAVLLDVYYTKGADGVWEVTAFNNADATNGGFPYASAPLATTLH
nr:flagellar hook-basal body complex protein [Rhizobium sp. ACO-34A]